MSADKNIDWNSVIKKEAVGIGGIDLGEVYEIKDENIVIQKGFLDKKWYAIPKSLVETFDGVVLRLKVTERELDNFEKKGYDMPEFDIQSPELPKTSKENTETITVPLMSEDLKVTKNIAEDNVNIIKEPVKETKTVKINLKREEIFIERRPPTEGSYSKTLSMHSVEEKSSESTSIEDFVDRKIELSIPLKREEVVINKKPYVKEEVVVKKKPVTEKEEVKEDVTREEIDT